MAKSLNGNLPVKVVIIVLGALISALIIGGVTFWTNGSITAFANSDKVKTNCERLDRHSQRLDKMDAYQKEILDELKKINK